MSNPEWEIVDATLRPRIRRVVRSILRDSHEAEDAVQDTFLRAFRNIGTLRDPAALPAWVITLARRAALDRYRRLSRRPEAIPEVHDVIDGRELSGADTMEIAEAYARLSPALRRAIDQRLQGLTLAQSAALERISVVAVKTRLTRARARLRAQIED
jgi:RNA polymerase sigma factor (sigma-70 family)